MKRLLFIALLLAALQLHAQSIIKAEYFFDADPGVAMGAPLAAFNAGDSIDIQTTISTSGLSVGLHKLYIRTNDGNNHWSLFEGRTFNIYGTPANEQIVAAEYFFDNDPGVGLGTAINLGSLSDSIDLTASIIVPPLSLGTHMLFIRTKNAEGAWSLFEGRGFFVCTTYGADANFAVNSKANTAFFTDSSQYVESRKWIFGDGQEDTVQVNPQHQYANGGIYNACLIAKSACGNDTFCTTVSINGLQSIAPGYGAQTGFITTRITGYGFQSGAFIKLIRAGYPDIIADTTIVKSITELHVNFKLKNAPLGMYDVVLINSSGNDTLFSAFEVQPVTADDLWVQVTGPNRVRVFNPGVFRVAVGNNGNAAVFSVPLIITVPGNRDIRVLSSVDTTNTPTNIRDLLPYGRTYWIMYHDTITGDSIKAMLFTIPMIRAGETKYFDFMGVQTTGGTFRFSAKITHPLFTSADIDSILAIDPHSNHIQTSCGALSKSACFDCILEILGIVPAPGLGCGVGLLNAVCSASAAAAGNQGMDMDDVMNDLTTTLISCATMGTTEAIEKATDLIGFMTGYWGAANACSDCFGDSKSEMDVKSVTPGDPNIKYGPSGATIENYFSGEDDMHYSIYFENVPTATAPAAEVFLLDTLDASSLDLSTFTFTGFGFGDSAYTLEDDLPSFSQDIDMRPTKNIILRVRGHLDANILTFKFSSYDPATMKITDSIDDGFLPPDVNYPEGVGYITYSVKPKPGLPHLTQINNYANIYFDQNPVVPTPLWTNTVDKVKPMSNVAPLNAITTDTLFKVSWSGNDAHAGIMDYVIYVSDNDSAYIPWLLYTEGATNWFHGEIGHTYKFFSQSRDRAMNVEDLKGAPDAQTKVLIGIDEHTVDAHSWLKQTVPNPFSAKSVVEFYLPSIMNVQLVVTDLLGKQIKIISSGQFSKGTHHAEIDGSELSNGVYFLKLVTPVKDFSQKLMVMHN